MLQSSFNLIREHFSPNSPIQRNIFLTKDYDYPNHFIQKLYLSYLQLEQTLITSSPEEIIKKINLVSSKNDSFENTILGIIYGLVLNVGNCRVEGKKLNEFDREGEKQKSIDTIGQKEDVIKFSEQMIAQIKKVIPLFRAEAWNLFNNIIFSLIMNHFKEIKPIYRLGLITLFDIMQEFDSCSDNLFILFMKTINFYDQTPLSIKYNTELLEHLNLSTLEGTRIERKDVRTKRDEQISLMRLYLFVKLVHIQYLIHRMRTFMKGEWPFHLQKLCVEVTKMLKKLFFSNADECLVFSAELLKYISYSVSDPELEEIYQRIKDFPVIKSEMLAHHYSLVPLSVEMMIPYQLEQSLNELEYSMTESGRENQEIRIEKQSVLMALGWIWRELTLKFSTESNKNYLLENTLPDIVRWAVTTNGRNMEFKTILIEWAMYQCTQNEIINKNVKHSFFQDLFYYLKNSSKVIFQLTQLNVEQIFPILSSPLYILNYFSFYSPHLAEQLFFTIFNKLSHQVFDRQPLSISEENLRFYLNEILYKANIQGLLRVNEILYHSHIGNHIKNELQLRIQEAEIDQPAESEKVERTTEKVQFLEKSTPERENLPLKPEMEYYGAKNLNIEFNIKDLELGNSEQEEEDLIYTSHELIPSSPSYEHITDPHLPNLSHLENNQLIVEKNEAHPFKRGNNISTHELEKEFLAQEKTPQQKTSQENDKKLNIAVEKKQETETKESHFEVQVEKEFYEEMGSEVDSLLANPSIIQFTEYMKQLTKTLKDYKKSGQEEEIIDTFIEETSKILYLAFNHEFESFNLTEEDFQKPKESELLTYFLLKSIHQHWKHSLSIYQVSIYKKIVKTLSESFSSCEFAFYLTFLDMFKKGLPHFREMKTWLIEKESEKYVIPALQKLLGKKFKIHLYENAQALKIQ